MKDGIELCVAICNAGKSYELFILFWLLYPIRQHIKSARFNSINVCKRTFHCTHSFICCNIVTWLHSNSIWFLRAKRKTKWMSIECVLAHLNVNDAENLALKHTQFHVFFFINGKWINISSWLPSALENISENQVCDLADSAICRFVIFIANLWTDNLFDKFCSVFSLLYWLFSSSSFLQLNHPKCHHPFFHKFTWMSHDLNYG